jgi:hypothetical protein
LLSQDPLPKLPTVHRSLLTVDSRSFTSYLFLPVVSLRVVAGLLPFVMTKTDFALLYLPSQIFLVDTLFIFGYSNSELLGSGSAIISESFLFLKVT